MTFLLNTILWSLCILLIFKISTTFFARAAFRTAMKKNGCLEPIKLPQKDPILGLDIFFKGLRHFKNCTLLEMLTNTHDLHGHTYSCHNLGEVWIRTMEPKNAQAMFSGNFADFGLGPLRYDIAAPFMGRGIFTTDGPFWEHSRTLIRPTFSRLQLSNLVALERHVDRMIALIPRDRSTVDMQVLFDRLILDTSTEFLFGKSTECLLPEPPLYSQQLIKAFNIAGEGLEKRAALGKFRFLYRSKRWTDAISFVHAFIDDCVDEALKVQAANKEQRNDENQDGYILLHEMAKETHDRMDLRYQILNVFVPSDSTAIAISNVFYLLARNKRVWELLRTEIMSLGLAPLTFETLKGLKYMRYVLNETHRLLPVIPLNSRVCLKDSVLPCGGGGASESPIFVQKGTIVSANIHAMHRDPTIWGDDAEDFRPERWETARPGWAYIPFLGGPRICVAQQMVLTESAYVIARLLREFGDIENRDPEPWRGMVKVSVKNKNGVKVGLIPA